MLEGIHVWLVMRRIPRLVFVMMLASGGRRVELARSGLENADDEQAHPNALTMRAQHG